jgi:hypothetical protein
MGKVIRVVPKKRGRKKTTGRGKLIGLRLHAPELATLDEWAAANDCTRPQALRRLMTIGLEAAPVKGKR